MSPLWSDLALARAALANAVARGLIDEPAKADDQSKRKIVERELPQRGRPSVAL